MGLFPVVAIALLSLVASANARLYYVRYEQQDSSAAHTNVDDSSGSSQGFSWILSMLEKQRQLDDARNTAAVGGSRFMEQEILDRKSSSSSSQGQGGWTVSVRSQDLSYDGSSTMNEEEATTAEPTADPGLLLSSQVEQESSSAYGFTDEAEALDVAGSSARFGSLLSSILCTLGRSTPYSQLEEPARYEPTTSGTLTYFGPFVFYSSISTEPSRSPVSPASSSTTTYYTGEYLEEEDEEYVESDESIAYYFEGVYNDDSTSTSTSHGSSALPSSLLGVFSRVDDWQLLGLSLLLVGAAWTLLLALRSYLELRQAIRRCGSSNSPSSREVSYPVVVERNGRRVRGYVVLPDPEEDFEDEEAMLEGGGGPKKGGEVGVPAKEALPPIVVAKDHTFDPHSGRS